MHDEEHLEEVPKPQSATTQGWIKDKAGVAYAFTFTCESWLCEWRVFDGAPWIGVASCAIKNG